MKHVEQAIENTIGKEGKYSDNPHDRGGKTMWGITEEVARANGYTGPMDKMPRDTARQIYREVYYLKPGFARVAEHSTAVAEELFDTGVNMGVDIASKFLQRALNVFNMSHKEKPLYDELVVDGKVGNASIKALGTFLRIRGREGEHVLLTALNSLQGVRYIELCEKRERNEEFVYGWFNHRVVI